MWTLLALVAGVAWLWHQEAGRRQLAAEVEGLKARLATPGEPARRLEDGGRDALTGLERQPIDWQAIAAKLKTSGIMAGGLLNENARLLAELEAKSAEELMAMLDQIAAADLSKMDRDVLEQRLVTILAKKAPREAFSRFSVAGRSNWSFFLGGIYKDWVRQDSTAAVTWMRDHVAAGGYYYPQMINAPFFDLLSSAPETSAEILACVPAQDRLESLRCLSVASLHGGGQKEWAEIVRREIPEADRAEAISWPIGNWSDGDGSPLRLDEVDAYLETIGASTAEREACVMSVAGTKRSWVTTTQAKQGEDGEGIQGFDQMREWVSKLAPGMLEAATIRGLEEIVSQGDFRAASELALGFHAAGGKDAYLCSVLDHLDDRANAEIARAMIDRLSDPALQAKYRDDYSSILKAE